MIHKYSIPLDAQDDAKGEMAIGFMQYMNKKGANMSLVMKYRLLDFIEREMGWNSKRLWLDAPIYSKDNESRTYESILCSSSPNPEQNLQTKEDMKMIVTKKLIAKRIDDRKRSAKSRNKYKELRLTNES